MKTFTLLCWLALGASAIGQEVRWLESLRYEKPTETYRKVLTCDSIAGCSAPISPEVQTQLPGLSSVVRPSFLNLIQWVMEVQVSPTSRRQPKATTAPQTSTHLNDFSLASASESRTGSAAGDGIVMRESRYINRLLTFLTFLGAIAVCEVVYISLRTIRR